MFWGQTGFFILVSHNLIEAVDCSCEFCCVPPAYSPGPSVPKVAHDAQFGKQRPPAAVCPAVVMPVLETLIFQESLKYYLLTE